MFIYRFQVAFIFIFIIINVAASKYSNHFKSNNSELLLHNFSVTENLGSHLGQRGHGVNTVRKNIEMSFKLQATVLNMEKSH